MGGKLDEKVYRSDETGSAMLELHAEHTLWKVETDFPSADPDGYDLLVRDLCERFKDESGVAVGCYGRSGRHVCVADTLYNRRDYQRLRKLALALEAECVRVCNAWTPVGGA